MIYRVFNRNWQSTQFAKKIDTYKHIRRAVDYNELQLHGEAIPNDIDPFFIGIFTDMGQLKSFMFFGVPEKDNVSGQVNVMATCLKTIFNNERIIDFSQASISTLGEALQVIFNAWATINCGISVNIDFSDVADISITDQDLLIDIIPVNKDVYNIFELVQKLLYFYNCYLDYEVSIKDKMVYFIISQATEEKTLLLNQYNVSDDVKLPIGLNMAQVIKSDGTGSVYYYLTRNNEITVNSSHSERLYPALMKCFISDIDEEDNNITELNYHQAKIDAILALAEKRYQQNFDIPVKAQDRLFAVDFKVKFNVYGKNGFYKKLPLGEIEIDQHDNKILRIGCRPQFLTQII